MLKIRLSRVGRKHEPVYRLILVESQEAAKTGKAIEILGSYDSRRGDTAVFDAERVKYWMSKGAQLSDTAHNLMVKRGLIEGVKRNVIPTKVIEAAKAKKIEANKPKEVVVEVPVVDEVVPEIVVETAVVEEVVA